MVRVFQCPFRTNALSHTRICQQNVAPAPFGPAAPVYPVLPPAPKNAKKGKRPAGGAIPDYPVQPAGCRYTRANKPVSQTQHRPSALPALVGLFFVLVQLLLLVRFVLRLLNFSGNVPWTGIIYAISGIFVLPFRLLLENINFPIPNTLEIYTLIAILVYGLLSRLIVRLLKVNTSLTVALLSFREKALEVTIKSFEKKMHIQYVVSSNECAR